MIDVRVKNLMMMMMRVTLDERGDATACGGRGVRESRKQAMLTL
jgi:hypothetical protein